MQDNFNKTMKMKKLSLVIFTMLGIFMSVQLSAQNTRYDDAGKGSIMESLWFGTGFGGFGLTNTSFQFGTSPIVGYKLLEGSSVGVRLPIDYFYVKLMNGNEAVTHNDWNLGIGAFARQKIIFNVFAHAELNHLTGDQLDVSSGGLTLDPNDNSRLLTRRYKRQEANVGLGYSAGNGGLAYEISLMYDFLADRTEPFAPLLIRAGLNYNF